MNNKLYGNLIFELSKQGRRGYSLPKTNLANIKFLPNSAERKMLHCLSATR